MRQHKIYYKKTNRYLILNYITMYLISEVFRKSRPVWNYFCQVFYCKNWNLSDVTSQVAIEHNYTIKDHSIAISHWCGTGINRITQALREKNKDVKVYDVSVFNS